MLPLVLSAPKRIGLVAAELVADRLRANPSARLVLPTGRTPDDMYAALRACAAEGALHSAGATVLQLDEYAGVAQDDDHSFAAQLQEQLRGVPVREIRTIDGAAADLGLEAERHAAALHEAPIDLAVLGLGRDGHVAFVEPPAERAEGVQQVRLAPETREDAAGEFGGEERVPELALTAGLGTLYGARELVMLVTGEAKAHALRAMLEQPPAPESPASLLRDHPRLTVVCDRDAASLLSPHPAFTSDRAVVAHGGGALRQAEQSVREEPARVVVLVGDANAAWDPALAPLVEVAGGEERLLRAVGDAREVSVTPPG